MKRFSAVSTAYPPVSASHLTIEFSVYASSVDAPLNRVASARRAAGQPARPSSSARAGSRRPTVRRRGRGEGRVQRLGVQHGWCGSGSTELVAAQHGARESGHREAEDK
jgi:hypothetical protein